MSTRHCRHCNTPLNHTFLDLGFAPPSNAYLTADALTKPEIYYPLKVRVCDRCWLVQTEDYTGADNLFSPDYAYFSSTSTSWLDHVARYAKKVIAAFGLNGDSRVMEIASNDGYLLKNFVAADIPCLGIEPTAGTAAAAQKLGIPVLQEFFSEALGRDLAVQGKQADLIIGNNVYAHVPDINDFTRGMKAALAPEGNITLEFPHLLNLIRYSHFDTVYHEHFSYLSLYSVGRIFKAAGLRIRDVESLSTHGGSLRVYGCHEEDPRPTLPVVEKMLAKENKEGLQAITTYQGFQKKADTVKNNLLDFLITQKKAGRQVAGYGAAAKGNTLLNYAGVKPDLLAFVCDAAVSKQGKFLPGSHIPILPPDALRTHIPDYVLILPWNLAAEIKEQFADLAVQGVKFVTAVPELEIT
jgi:SAM-dependent methyltransferase